MGALSRMVQGPLSAPALSPAASHGGPPGRADMRDRPAALAAPLRPADQGEKAGGAEIPADQQAMQAMQAMRESPSTLADAGPVRERRGATPLQRESDAQTRRDQAAEPAERGVFGRLEDRERMRPAAKTPSEEERPYAPARPTQATAPFRAQNAEEMGGQRVPSSPRANPSATNMFATAPLIVRERVLERTVTVLERVVGPSREPTKESSARTRPSDLLPGTLARSSIADAAVTRAPSPDATATRSDARKAAETTPQARAQQTSQQPPTQRQAEPEKRNTAITQPGVKPGRAMPDSDRARAPRLHTAGSIRACHPPCHGAGTTGSQGEYRRRAPALGLCGFATKACGCFAGPHTCFGTSCTSGRARAGTDAGSALSLGVGVDWPH
jgi:hypothetical protein